MAREESFQVGVQYTVPGEEIPETGASFTDTLYFHVTDDDDIALLRQIIARTGTGKNRPTPAAIELEKGRRLKQYRDEIKRRQAEPVPPPPPEVTTDQLMGALAKMLAPAVADHLASEQAAPQE